VLAKSFLSHVIAPLRDRSARSYELAISTSCSEASWVVGLCMPHHIGLCKLKSLKTMCSPLSDSRSGISGIGKG
jgi:hypothetical protein